MTFKPAADPAELTRLAQDAKAPAMKLARRMLDALDPKTLHDVTALVGHGWNVAAEFSVDGFGQPWICLTAVGPGGQRKLLASIPRGGPSAAN